MGGLGTREKRSKFYANVMQVLVHLEEQSPDIGQGVHGLGTKTLEETGAGDQGHMFGYASDETEQLMPLTHVLATQLGYKLTEVHLSLLLLNSSQRVTEALFEDMTHHLRTSLWLSFLPCLEHDQC